MTEVPGHLWEYDHPYYCAEGNYFKVGQHEHFESWEEFADGTSFFQGDRDQNLLIRWDWHSWRRHPDPAARSDSPDELVLHFVLQRKALLCSAGIAVTDDDEPRVREFLEECGKVIAAIWEPVGLAQGDARPAPTLTRSRAATPASPAGHATATRVTRSAVPGLTSAAS